MRGEDLEGGLWHSLQRDVLGNDIAIKQTKSVGTSADTTNEFERETRMPDNIW